MGGVILLVAYNLVDIHHIKTTLALSKSESAVLLTTFFATLFLELEFAIYLGVLLSLIFFLAKTSTPRIPTLSFDEPAGASHRKLVNIDSKPIKQCPQLKIIRIDMSIYFGSINHIQKRLTTIVDNERIYHILIIGSGINFIDLAGIEALESEQLRLKKLGGGLYFLGLKSSVYEFAARAGFIKHVGSSNFFDSKTQAIKTIYKKMDADICLKCHSQIFEECP
jgi:SulP family sulfate permease